MSMEQGRVSNGSSADGVSYEALLQGLAETVEFSVPDEVVSYTRAVSRARETVKGVRRVVADTTGMDGKCAQAIEQYCVNIERVIEDHHLDEVAASVQERVNHYNGLIDQARKEHLQGTFLTAANSESILCASKDCPVDVQMPGMPLVCGVHGQQGLDYINGLLAQARRNEAKEKYDAIIEAATPARQNIQSIGEAKSVEIPVPDPDPDPDYITGGGGVSGVTGGSVAGGSGSAGVALPSFGAAGLAAGVAGAGVAAGVAIPRTHVVSSGVPSSSGLGMGVPPVPSPGSGGFGSIRGTDTAGSSLAADGSSGRRDPYVPLPSFEDAARPQGPGSEYVYDPVSGEWVKRDALAASVDSAGSVNGFGAGIAGTAVGAGSAVAGTRLGSSAIPSVSGAGVAGGVALPSFGTASGVAGTAGGSAVGSYFANTPVAATVTPSSSIRGAQGMAAGLPQSTVATQSAAKSGAASPAMMAGGQGAGANNEKRERRGMAYMAPHLEEEEEDIAVKPRAAMAGHRRRAGE